MTQPLDYQHPHMPAGDPVLEKMRRQEYGNASIGTALLLGGVGVTLVTLMIATGVVTFVLWTWFDSSFIGYWGWFVLLLIALVPYLTRMEKRTHGQFWADSVAGSGVDWGNPGSVGELYQQRLLGSVLAAVETLLIGPRMLVGGYQRVRGVEVRQFDLFLGRCAEFVRDLASLGGSSPVVKLARPGETPAVIDKIVTHLDKRDWIGHSSDRQRVWLSSRAKDDLVKWGEQRTSL